MPRSVNDCTELRILWLDPLEILAHVSSIQSLLPARPDPDQLSLFLDQPEFRKPLRPGIWTILVLMWDKTGGSYPDFSS